MRAILALVAIIGALGAVISLIPAQQVIADRPNAICLRPEICGDESAALTHANNEVSETGAQISAHVTRCYNPEAGGFPTPEAPEPCVLR